MEQIYGTFQDKWKQLDERLNSIVTSGTKIGLDIGGVLQRLHDTNNSLDQFILDVLLKIKENGGIIYIISFMGPRRIKENTQWIYNNFFTNGLIESEKHVYYLTGDRNCKNIIAHRLGLSIFIDDRIDILKRFNQPEQIISERVNLGRKIYDMKVITMDQAYIDPLNWEYLKLWAEQHPIIIGNILTILFVN